jgi:hypothetical protein
LVGESLRAEKCPDSLCYCYLMPLSALSDPSARPMARFRAEVLPLFVGSRNFYNSRRAFKCTF